MKAAVVRVQALEQRLHPPPPTLSAQFWSDVGRIYGDGTPAASMTWTEVDAAIARIYGGDSHADGEATTRD